MVVFRRDLFRADWPSAPMLIAGVGMIILEGWIFWRVRRDLGGARLVGATELSGAGEIASRGIYGRLRHPRYAGSFLAIVGACLLAGTRLMWITAAVWMALTLLAIALEEREMRARFGGAYSEYCRRVPRFIPAGRSSGIR
jgi:protein-S-isoprenylcysteine O-methyltransferase Ste14